MSVYIWIPIIIVGLVLLAMYNNDYFRQITNEIWGHYFLRLLEVAWPYVAIYLLYQIIVDGTLANALRSAFH